MFTLVPSSQKAMIIKSFIALSAKFYLLFLGLFFAVSCGDVAEPEIIYKTKTKEVIKEVPKRANYLVKIDKLVFDITGEFNNTDDEKQEPFVTFNDATPPNDGDTYEVQSAFEKFNDNYLPLSPKHLTGFLTHTDTKKKIKLTKLYPHKMGINNEDDYFYYRIIKRNSKKEIVAVSKQDYVRLYWRNVTSIRFPNLSRIEKKPVFVIMPSDDTFYLLAPTIVTSASPTDDPSEPGDKNKSNVPPKQNLLFRVNIGYNRKAFETMDMEQDLNFSGKRLDLDKRRGQELMDENMPLELKYFTVVLQEYSAVGGGLEFTPGRTYYFYTTGTGDKADETLLPIPGPKKDKDGNILTVEDEDSGATLTVLDRQALITIVKDTGDNIFAVTEDAEKKLVSKQTNAVIYKSDNKSYKFEFNENAGKNKSIVLKNELQGKGKLKLVGYEGISKFNVYEADGKTIKYGLTKNNFRLKVLVRKN